MSKIDDIKIKDILDNIPKRKITEAIFEAITDKIDMEAQDGIIWDAAVSILEKYISSEEFKERVIKAATHEDFEFWVKEAFLEFVNEKLRVN